MKLYIGLMSGTSMDGIDAALVDVETNALIAGLIYPYSEEARQLLNEVLSALHHPGRYSQLNTLLGREFGKAVLALLKTAPVTASQIIAIGSHGQTICHNTLESIPYTVQLGCGHTIAEMTSIPVVADFRTRDLVVGGQGAPFAPLYHQALFGDLYDPLAIINIGGIANLTYLERSKAVIGYDVGPGNCLMDAWIRQQLQQPYDKQGAWALSGKVIEQSLNSMMQDPFFQQSPPKSLGKEYFSNQWLARHFASDAVAEDVQATLLEFTARSIAESIKQQDPRLKQVFVCGGGVHNQALMARLQVLLPNHFIASTATVGIDPDYIEAQLFAWLADKTMTQSTVDLKSITGAKTPTILGAIYPVSSPINYCS